MTRSIFRYVPYTLRQDLTALPEYEAECVSGEETECGAESGRHYSPDDVEEWMRKHTQDNPTHRRYLRMFSDYAVWEEEERSATQAS